MTVPYMYMQWNTGDSRSGACETPEDLNLGTRDKVVGRRKKSGWIDPNCDSTMSRTATVDEQDEELGLNKTSDWQLDQQDACERWGSAKLE